MSATGKPKTGPARILKLDSDRDRGISLFDAVADLTLSIESSDRTRHERDASSGFVRASTVYALHGDGGGQFELAVGRSHVQALASLFSADGPNDVAPGVYNEPETADGPNDVAPGVYNEPETADGPNDVAPGVYNEPETPDDAPTSPLEPSAEPVGLGF